MPHYERMKTRITTNQYKYAIRFKLLIVTKSAKIISKTVFKNTNNVNKQKKLASIAKMNKYFFFKSEMR